MLRFGPSYWYRLLNQRLGAQKLRRQPEMDQVMLDEEQDREFAEAGERGGLAILYDLIVHMVLQLAPTAGEALDVATGSGQLLAKLAVCLPEMRFVGTDLSAHMLDVARASATRYGATNIDLALQDMFALGDLAPRRFDLITWFLAAHHCNRSRDVVRVLNGIQTLLKPNGTFVLFDIARPRTGGAAVALADLYNFGGGSWYYQDSLDSYKAAFTFDELERILAQSSLSGASHVEPTLGNFFQLVYVSSTRKRVRAPRSYLTTVGQRLDYWLLRLGFAGKY